MLEKSRIDHSLVFFRAFSIVLVVISHSYVASILPNHELFRFLFSEGTSCFLFISGYFFSRLELNRYVFWRYLNKKIKFVLVPYFAVLVPFILLYVFLGKSSALNMTDRAYFIWSIIVGGVQIGPLWFVPMIFLFYLLSPLFILILRYKRFLWVVVICGLFFTCFTSRPIGNMNPFLSFLHFFGFYVMGLLVGLDDGAFRSIAGGRANFWICFLFLSSVFLVLMFFSFRFGLNGQGFFDNFMKLNFIQLGKVVFIFILLLISFRYFHRVNSLVAYIADVSFGLFFLHGIFLLIFRNFLLIHFFQYSWGVVFFELAFSVLGSLMLIRIFKLFLGDRSRYVIGC